MQFDFNFFPDAAPAVQQPPLALPSSGNIEVRKYDPKAKKMILKNVIRTNWGIQKSKVQNNIMYPLGDSS